MAGDRQDEPESPLKGAAEAWHSSIPKDCHTRNHAPDQSAIADDYRIYEASSKQAQPIDKFSFLEQLTARKRHHGTVSFYQHLYNVYSILKEESLPEAVCDAGLFHSIYGTEYFKFQSDAVTRDVIRSYIGDYAEELAYIFCSLKKNRIRSIIDNTPGWTSQQHLDLCCVEFANLWDHRGCKDLTLQLNALAETIARLENELASSCREACGQEVSS